MQTVGKGIIETSCPRPCQANIGIDKLQTISCSASPRAMDGVCAGQIAAPATFQDGFIGNYSKFANLSWTVLHIGLAWHHICGGTGCQFYG